MSHRPRILIVNAYFDDARRPTRRATTVLKALGPVYLAGAFRPEVCDIELWDEQTCGPLVDLRRLSWPNILVLTGLTAAFDRMRQLSAYARQLSPGVVVIAGGPAIRSLPEESKTYFDYALEGDVEELAEAATEILGTAAVDPTMPPRYELASWLGSFGYAESSRNCNFACEFCSLTGERGRYVRYPTADLERQLDRLGRRRFLIFIDNNFYGNDRRAFLERLDLVESRYRRGDFKGFGALVTSDFFAIDENLERIRAAGCKVLFCGVESFDTGSIENYGKTQNLKLRPEAIIAKALEAGILLIYGVMSDVVQRRLVDIDAEIDWIIANDRITLPTFIVLPIPFPRTPYFRRCVDEGRFLPNTRLRDLDGSTLSLMPRDPLPDVAEWVRRIQHLDGRRMAVLRHMMRFTRRYRSRLGMLQLGAALARDAAFAFGRVRRTKRTHVSSTDVLDALYRPMIPLDSRYESWFRPTMVTGPDGELDPRLADQYLGGQGIRVME